MTGAGAVRRLLNFWPATGIVASIAGAAIIAATAGGDNPIGLFFGPIQDRFFDSLLRRRDSHAIGDPVVIVGIDVATPRQYGNKIPRSVIADTLDRVEAAGARVIVLDLIYNDKDDGSTKVEQALEMLEREVKGRIAPESLSAASERVRARFNDDEKLAKALGRTHTIAVYVRTPARESGVPEDYWKRIPESETVDAVGCESAGKQTEVLLDAPLFFDSAKLHASAFISPDLDGVVRRYPLFSHIGNSPRLYPSAALLAATVYLDEQRPQADCTGAEVKNFSLGARDFSDVVDVSGTVRINFGGSFRDSFPERTANAAATDAYPADRVVPLRDALAKKPDGDWVVPDERFANKIVFIGERTDEEDRYTTPYDTVFNGIGFHATVASNLVKGNWLRRKSLQYQGLEAIAGLLLGMLGVLGIVFFPRFAMLLVAVALTFLGVVVSAVALSHGYLINGLFPGAVGTLSMLVTFSSRFFLAQTMADEEKKQREATQRELGRFLSPAIVDIALRDPNLLAPAKREISILFSDIRGFTTTAEGMSPEALVALLDGYLTRMTQIVFDEKGTLDKYIGDAVMALFGAPVSFDDHPVYACRAALDMMAALKIMQKDWAATGQPILDIGIGVNTGVVSVGRMGSSGKSEYTCLGDEVNFASRLEGLNKAYGSHILVGDTTRARAGDLFLYRDLGLVQVKGKKKATRIFELLGERKSGETPPAWMPDWDAALAAFLRREWNESERLFTSVATARGGDRPAETFLEFIEVFRTAPPARDWEGTIERHEK